MKLTLMFYMIVQQHLLSITQLFSECPTVQILLISTVKKLKIGQYVTMTKLHHLLVIELMFAEIPN